MDQLIEHTIIFELCNEAPGLTFTRQARESFDADAALASLQNGILEDKASSIPKTISLVIPDSKMTIRQQCGDIRLPFLHSLLPCCVNHD
jgi:hypothetical protein